MSTAALRDYGASSATVSALLALESTYRDPPEASDQSLVEGLRGGSIVLIVAAFENYLKESFTEVLERVNVAQPPCDFEKLPIALRTQAVFVGLEYAMKGRPGSPRGNSADRLPGVLNAVRRINNRELIADAIAKTAGNPDSEQVSRIYKIIGYSSPFTKVRASFDLAWGTPTAVTFIKDTLDIIVARRHVVAHTASILSTSRDDLATWKRFVDTLASVFDAALERQVDRVIERAR